jgi:hypothetical protein
MLQSLFKKQESFLSVKTCGWLFPLSLLLDGWSKETLAQKISGPCIFQTENWAETNCKAVAKLY